jgi:single-stranded-DNA-specific exonuclease
VLFRSRPEPTPEVQCDLLITDPELLSLENVRALDQLEPYGNANPKPVLCVSGVPLEALTEVGGGRHCRMRIRLGNTPFECIFFSHSAAEAGVREGEKIDMAFTPQVNEYRGSVSVQLVAMAVRPHDGSGLCAGILAGDPGVNRAAAPWCPDRADFVRVWRSMPAGFAVSADAEGVLAQCPKGMSPETFCLCLMVLREAGLLSGGEGIFSARPASIDGKADLEATELLRSLRSLQ